MWFQRFLLVSLAFHFLLLISHIRAQNQPTNAEIVTFRRLLATTEVDDRNSRILTRRMSAMNKKDRPNNHGGGNGNIDVQMDRMSSSFKPKKSTGANKVKQKSKWWTIESVSSSSTEDIDECALLRERNAQLEKELRESTRKKAQLEKELRETAETRARLENELREKTKEHAMAVELANELAQQNMELEQKTKMVGNGILALRKEVQSIKRQLPRSCGSGGTSSRSKITAITKPESRYDHHEHYTASSRSSRSTAIPQQDVHGPHWQEQMSGTNSNAYLLQRRELILPPLDASSSNQMIKRQQTYFPRKGRRSPAFHTHAFGSDTLDVPPQLPPLHTLNFTTDVFSHSRTRTISTHVRNFYNHDHISGYGNVYSHYHQNNKRRRPSGASFRNVHHTSFLPVATNSDTFFGSPTTFHETLSPPHSSPNPIFSKPGIDGRYNNGNHNNYRHPSLANFRKHFSGFGKSAPYNNKNRPSRPTSRSHYLNREANFWANDNY